MPELPEVEVSKNCLRDLTGFRLANVILFNSLRKIPDVKDFDLSTVDDVYRRGKWLLLQHKRKTTAFHFGMTGMLYQREKDNYQVAQFQYRKGAQQTVLTYCDIRRFGQIVVVDNAEVESWISKMMLGLEPLNPKLDRAVLRRKLNASRLTIKDWLLDQSNLAGIGNIYANEILYACGLNPQELANRCGGDLALLLDKTGEILKQAVKLGGSSISDFRSPLGEKGKAQTMHQVYGKEGESCQCGDRIIREVKGRASFVCPTCQPLKAAEPNLFCYFN